MTTIDKAPPNPLERPIANRESTAYYCGSELAREGAMSATIPLADPPHSRASPLPHSDPGQPPNLSPAHQPCHRPAPILSPSTNPVGAGLLAKAPCQPTSPSTDPPHSRVSPLPQSDPGQPPNLSPAHQPCHRPAPILSPSTNPVGAGLLAKAPCQPTSPSTDPPHSRASPLPHSDPGQPPNLSPSHQPCHRPAANLESTN